MNAQLKELAYGAAYNAFLNANRMERAGLSESQINILNWLEPSMADAYARLMVANEGNQEESLKVVFNMYQVENLKLIFKAIEAGEFNEFVPGLAN